jgi:hypothetical protein
VSIGLVILNYLSFHYVDFLSNGETFEGIAIHLPELLGNVLESIFFFNILPDPFNFFSPVVTILGLILFLIYEHFIYEDDGSINNLFVSDFNHIFGSLFIGFLLLFLSNGIVLLNLSVVFTVLFEIIYTPLMYWVYFIPNLTEYFSDPFIFLESHRYVNGLNYLILTIIFHISIYKIFTRRSRFIKDSYRKYINYYWKKSFASLRPVNLHYTLEERIVNFMKKVLRIIRYIYNTSVKFYITYFVKGKGVYRFFILYFTPFFLFTSYPLILVWKYDLDRIIYLENNMNEIPIIVHLVLSIITFFRVIKKNRVTRRVDLKEEIKKEILEDRMK